MPGRPNLIILANAFVSTKSIGGGDRFIIQISPTLAKRAKTAIITPSVGLHHWRKMTRFNLVKKCFIPLKSSIFDDRDHPIAIMLAYIARCIQTINILQKKAPTHLITASQYFPDVFPAYMIKRSRSNLRWIARIYHLIPPPQRRVGNPLVNSTVFLLQNLMLSLLKGADLVVADNPETIRQLTKRGFAKEKLTLLTSGVPFQEISSHRTTTKKKYDAAYIGRLDSHRGIFDLPLIWKQVTKTLPNATLAIVGYGPQSTTAKLKGKFREHRLENSVTFLGFLPHQDNGEHPLYDLLHSIKVLLLPIHEGGWPLTVAEAMAAGVPVIAYELPIFTTIYRHGVFTVEMKDTQALAQQVSELLKNKDKRTEIGKRAQNEARRFDIKKIANQFSQLILDNT